MSRRSSGSSTSSRPSLLLWEARRRSPATGHTLRATLACDRCDAPIAPGERPLPVTARVVCPFCGRRASLSDFVSLARPTRPAHVLIRLAVEPLLPA